MESVITVDKHISYHLRKKKEECFLTEALKQGRNCFKDRLEQCLVLQDPEIMVHNIPRACEALHTQRARAPTLRAAHKPTAVKLYSKPI